MWKVAPQFLGVTVFQYLWLLQKQSFSKNRHTNHLYIKTFEDNYKSLVDWHCRADLHPNKETQGKSKLSYIHFLRILADDIMKQLIRKFSYWMSEFPQLLPSFPLLGRYIQLV